MCKLQQEAMARNDEMTDYRDAKVSAQAAIIASQAGEITALTEANKLLAAQVAGPVEGSIGDDEQFESLLWDFAAAKVSGTFERRFQARKHLIAYLDSRAAKVSARAADAPSEPSEISAQLREYAGNPGYSHGDYADTMRRAADALDSQPTETQPGSPNFDGAEAFEAFQAAGGYSSQPTDGEVRNG